MLVCCEGYFHSTTEGSTLLAHFTGFPCCSLVMCTPLQSTVAVPLQYYYLRSCRVATPLVVLRSGPAAGVIWWCSLFDRVSELASDSKYQKSRIFSGSLVQLLCLVCIPLQTTFCSLEGNFSRIFTTSNDYVCIHIHPTYLYVMASINTGLLSSTQICLAALVALYTANTSLPSTRMVVIP